MYTFFHNGKANIAQLVTWNRIPISTDLLTQRQNLPSYSSDPVFKLSGKMCEANA